MMKLSWWDDPIEEWGADTSGTDVNLTVTGRSANDWAADPGFFADPIEEWGEAVTYTDPIEEWGADTWEWQPDPTIPDEIIGDPGNNAGDWSADPGFYTDPIEEWESMPDAQSRVDFTRLINQGLTLAQAAARAIESFRTRTGQTAMTPVVRSTVPRDVSSAGFGGLSPMMLALLGLGYLALGAPGLPKDGRRRRTR